MRDELFARLALRALPGISDARRLELLRRYGSAKQVLVAGAPPLGRDQVRALRSERLAERIDHAARAIDLLGVRVLSPVDPEFPPLPPPIEPPPVLFVRGDLGWLHGPCAAIVGTRRCTEYGEDVADELAAALARAGVTVISGLARGIDGVAHRAAIGAGGGTIAVLGCGIDVAYPREHAGLQEEIGESGLLLSEFLPGEPPRPHHFLQRNRLIAGYARAVIVVEGGSTSGAINTAHYALDADLPIFGVPGPLGRGTSDGPLELLRDGAHLYTQPLDVLLALGCVSRAGAADRSAAAATVAEPELPVQLQRLANAGLSRRAEHIDTISASLGERPAETLAALLELELVGRVEQLPGMRFRLARRRPAAAAAPASGRADRADRNRRRSPG